MNIQGGAEGIAKRPMTPVTVVIDTLANINNCTVVRTGESSGLHITRLTGGPSLNTVTLYGSNTGAVGSFRRCRIHDRDGGTIITSTIDDESRAIDPLAYSWAFLVFVGNAAGTGELGGKT